MVALSDASDDLDPHGRQSSAVRGMAVLPFVWAAVLTTTLTVPFSSLSWSFIDTYNVFYQATEPTWREAVTQAFGSGVEYRPLQTLLTKLTHQIVGLRLWFYKTLVILQFAAILGLLIWLFRPVGRRRAVAACVAISCVVALHTSRALFLFVPLNLHSLGLVLLLGAAVLAIESGARTARWIWFALTVIALLLLESGFLIVPVVTALWLMQAPGASRRAVLGAVAGTVCYLAIRFASGALAAPSVYVATGLGFSAPGPERLSEIFRNGPWLFWLYNVASSLLTVLASEPRGGVWEFIKSVLDGDTPAWRWLHVVSSLATTAMILAGLSLQKPRVPRDRYLVAVGLVLLVCGSALGFLYTRDRIGLSAGVGYSILVYVATATWLERYPSSSWRRAVVTIAIATIAAAWIVRDGEAYFQIRDTVPEHRSEWTARYETLRAGRPETDLMVLLRVAALSSTPPDPRLDPKWTYVLFERVFERSHDAP